MLNDIKEQIRECINKLENLQLDIGYHLEDEMVEDIDIEDWREELKNIINKLEDVIKEDD